MPTESVFLTGGSGFVGSHVLRELLLSGYAVRALSRDSKGERILQIAGPHADCTIVAGDLQSPGSFARALEGCTYVIHCAAAYSFSLGMRSSLDAINVKGTAGLLEAAHIAGAARAVVTSSSAVLGSARDGRPRTESDWETGALHAGYHASKVRQERAAFASRVPVVSLLPTAPVGPGDWKPTPTGQIILDFACGKMFALPPHGGINLVPVEDVARAHVAALQYGRAGERYILGGENLLLDDLWQLLSAITKKPLPHWRAPAALAVAAARAEEVRSRFTGSRPLIPLEGARMASELMFADSSKARRELGFSPGAVSEALERALLWYRGNGSCA